MIRWARSGSISWPGDRLTLITRPEPVRPCSVHARACRQAERRTNESISPISPSSSARGTNSRGSTRPPTGCAQRTSASKPTIETGIEVVDRLVVREEVAVEDGRAQLASCSMRARTAVCISSW